MKMNFLYCTNLVSIQSGYLYSSLNAKSGLRLVKNRIAAQTHDGVKQMFG